MNLRILKKLSKRAAPLLPLLGDNREQFAAIKGGNYHGLIGFPRKDCERRRSRNATSVREGTIQKPAKDGNGWIHIYQPGHPRKGSIMVGATTGYYEPEWDEETAWEALSGLVYAHFTDWSRDDAPPTRRFYGPGDILRAAKEIAACHTPALTPQENQS